MDNNFRFKNADYSSYISTSEYEADKEIGYQKEYLLKLKDYTAAFGDKIGHKPSACVVTFGCQMNARDSEKLAGVLKEAGFEISESEEADLVVFNTCTVRDNANQRVYGRLGALHAMKKSYPDKKIAICGCMTQEPQVIEKLKKTYSFVNLIFGTHNIYKFPELLCRMFESDKLIIDVWKDTREIVEAFPTVRKYPFKSGVNIMFGCDNFCTYCIVPYVRGRERSRRSNEILDEVRRLADDGVVEVMLLGQNVNSYGNGIEGEMSFPQLLKKTAEIPGIRRVRFMTSNPKDLSDELIEVMASSNVIARHLHLPVQSGSDRVLKAMNRHYTHEEYLALVDKLRSSIHGLALTTDIIVGFPTETPEDVEETVRLVNEVGFDNAFTFIYSKRTGTPAADLEMAMSPEQISECFDKVLKTVQDNARKSAAALTGLRSEVLVEEINEHDPSLVTGRLSNNYLVHFPGDASMIGKLVNVELTENKGFYFYGRII